VVCGYSLYYFFRNISVHVSERPSHKDGIPQEWFESSDHPTRYATPEHYHRVNLKPMEKTKGSLISGTISTNLLSEKLSTSDQFH